VICNIIQILTGAERNIEGIIPKVLQCCPWPRATLHNFGAFGLTVNICFVISQNKCNKFVSSSMTQQQRIRIDPPKIVVKQKIYPNAWCDSLCHVPQNMDHVIHVPREHDTALTTPGNIVYFCTSCDAHWTNHDPVIQTVI